MARSDRLALIQEIERRAYNAWPAAETLSCDGWRARFASGVTHRANSVWPNEVAGNLHLDDRMALVEEFYSQRDRPAIYQICPAAQPSDLDTVLDERGFERGRTTSVHVAPLADVLRRCNCSDHRVVVSDRLERIWLDLYSKAARVGELQAAQRRETMGRIDLPVAYAVAWEGDEPCAVGSAVVERGWMGLYNMVTRPECRRRGAAIAIARALIAWAQQQTATDIYLQVMHDNAPALALYARLGFSTFYDYHYRWIDRIEPK